MEELQILKQLPKHVSVTLLGLDAYFKAFFFLLKFASNKLQAASYDIPSLFTRSTTADTTASHEAHFVVEVSWIEEDPDFIDSASASVEGVANEFSTKDSTVLTELQSVHNRMNSEYSICTARKWLLSPEKMLNLVLHSDEDVRAVQINPAVNKKVLLTCM